MSRGYSTPPPLSLTFSLFLTFLHYSFIYSNYPHHVNLSLPLISPSPNISFNVSIKIIPCGYNFLRSIFFDESKRGDANYPRNWASTTGAHHVLSIYIYRRRFPIYEIAKLASHSTRGFRFLEVRGVRTLTSFPVKPYSTLFPTLCILGCSTKRTCIAMSRSRGERNKKNPAVRCV